MLKTLCDLMNLCDVAWPANTIQLLLQQHCFLFLLQWRVSASASYVTAGWHCQNQTTTATPTLAVQLPHKQHTASQAV
jgi:hypothetical protein